MKHTIIVTVFLSFIYADFGANVLVSDNAGSHNKMPDITVDVSGNIHVVWINNDNNTNIFYARSTDHGSTFSTPVQVNTYDGHVSDIMYSGPKIVAVGNTIHVIWADKRNGYDETNIYYSYSMNGGNTWSEDEPIGDNTTFNIYCEIVAGESGGIHVVYYQFNRRFLNFEKINHIASSDTGQTFSDDETVSNYTDGIPCDCCPPDILILNDGTKMVGFRNDIDDIRDTYASFSGADENEWGSITQLSFDDYEINVCPSSGPGMSRLGNKVAVSYMAGIDNTKKVFLKTSHDDAHTFGDSVWADPSATDDISQDHPSTAITDGNWIHMIWEDERGGTDIYYGGMNASNSEITNIQVLNDDGLDVTQMAPRMSDDGHFVYVVWEDYRDAQQIYFTTNYDPDAGVGDELNPSIFKIKGLYPNPFNNNLNIDLSLDVDSDVRMNVIDVSGRVVDTIDFGPFSNGDHTFSWNGTGHPSGVYTIQLHAGGFMKTQKVIYLK